MGYYVYRWKLLNCDIGRRTVIDYMILMKKLDKKRMANLTQTQSKNLLISIQLFSNLYAVGSDRNWVITVNDYPPYKAIFTQSQQLIIVKSREMSFKKEKKQALCSTNT